MIMSFISSVILTGLLILVNLTNDHQYHHGPISGVQAQGLLEHEHPHKVMAKSPCPRCLDQRFVQHYHQRQCRPVVLGGCQCPSRFDCHGYLDENNNGVLTGPGTLAAQKLGPGRAPSTFDNRGPKSVFVDADSDDDDDNHCHYQGQVYQIGQLVPIEDPCRICVCHYMNDGTLNIDCQTRIECPAGDSRVDSGDSDSEADFNGYVNVKPPGKLTMLRTQFRRRRGPQSGSGSAVSASAANPNETSLLTLFCYDFYKHDRCCPRQECLSINSRTGKSMRPRKVCHYGGQEYHLGEKIKLKSILDDRAADSWNQVDGDAIHQTPSPSKQALAETLACLSCICTEHWNNTAIQQQILIQNDDPGGLSRTLMDDRNSCKRKHCYLDLDPKFRGGCIPVYDEEKCCPVDFICPRTRQMSLRVRGVDFGSKMCHFEGRKYPIGARIYQTKHWAAECVDCECRLPPEFTCLRRKDCVTAAKN